MQSPEPARDLLPSLLCNDWRNARHQRTWTGWSCCVILQQTTLSLWCVAAGLSFACACCTSPFLFPANALSREGTAEADVDLHLFRYENVAVMQRLLDDEDASVRHAVAAHCCSLCCSLGGGHLGAQWGTWILDALHNFLRGLDGAVRCTAVDAISFIVMLLLGFSHGYLCADPVVRLEREQAAKENKTASATAGADAHEPLPGAMPSWAEVESSIRRC